MRFIILLIALSLPALTQANYQLVNSDISVTNKQTSISNPQNYFNTVAFSEKKGGQVVSNAEIIWSRNKTFQALIRRYKGKNHFMVTEGINIGGGKKQIRTGHFKNNKLDSMTVCDVQEKQGKALDIMNCVTVDNNFCGKVGAFGNFAKQVQACSELEKKVKSALGEKNLQALKTKEAANIKNHLSGFARQFNERGTSNGRRVGKKGFNPVTQGTGGTFNSFLKASLECNRINSNAEKAKIINFFGAAPPETANPSNGQTKAAF